MLIERRLKPQIKVKLKKKISVINEKDCRIIKIFLEFIHHPHTHAKEKRCMRVEYPSKVSQPLNKQD